MALTSLLRGTPVDYQTLSTNRFYLEFPTEMNLEGYWVQSVGSLTADIKNVEIPYIHTASYMTTSYRFGTLDIKFIDVIAPSSSMKLMEWVRLHMEAFTGRMGYDAGSKKDLYFNRIDSVGVTVAKWLIGGASITKVDWNGGEYGEGGLVLPSITCQPTIIERLF